MVLAAAEALLPDDPDVDARSRRVVDDPRHARWCLELEDARLAYGRWLRRRRRFPEARVQLLGALQAFERIGARPRVEAAREEPGQVGGAAASDDAATWSSLTRRERQVVRLAAAGLTHREIGESVLLSPRTVGSASTTPSPGWASPPGTSSRAWWRGSTADCGAPGRGRAAAG